MDVACRSATSRGRHGRWVMSDDPPFSADRSSIAETVSTATTRPARENLPVFRQLPHATSFAAADLELTVSIELGRVQMKAADVLNIPAGTFLELNKSAGDPVDIVINEQVIARGEVVRLDGRFAVRIVELMPVNPAE